MEKVYFIDTLFDLMNESDTLEAELQDIRADREGLTMTMKDGTVFTVTVVCRNAGQPTLDTRNSL